MSTLLQLLYNYWESVVTSERIYQEQVRRACTGKSVVNGVGPERGMLLLQRQVHELTSELQKQNQENDSLRELHKAQRALLESKLNNYKKTIEKFRKQNHTVDDERQLKKGSADLLPSLSGRRLEGIGRTKGLGRTLLRRQRTVFDDSDNDDDDEATADRMEEVKFVGSAKRSGAKQETEKGEVPLNKKRRLTRIRIQSVSSGSEKDDE